MNRILALLIACVMASPAMGEVEVSGDVDLSPKAFTLVLVSDVQEFPGGYASGSMAQWVKQPTTAEMSRWVGMSNVKIHNGVDALMESNHKDILMRAQSLPIIALMDGAGGTLCVFSGDDMPESEYELARRLDTYWGAIVTAASDVGTDAYRVMSADKLQSMRGLSYSKFRPDRNTPRSGPFNINPQINAPEGGIPVNHSGSVADKTLYVIAGCVGVFVLGAIICVAILAEAMTDDD